MGTLNYASRNRPKMRHVIQRPFTMCIIVKVRKPIRGQIDSLLAFIIDDYTERQMDTRGKR